MSNMVFGVNRGEALLVEAFALGFDDPATLSHFLPRLAQIRLPFDLFDQIRKIEFPGYTGFDCGLPPCYYYFIPNTGFGSERAFPADPLATEFPYSTDGFGLNMGCPLRLKRAIEILICLPESQRAECQRDLALPSKHLATVEELLWLDIWKSGSNFARSEGNPNHTHDWVVTQNGLTIRQECKLRPVDWVRLVEGEGFQPMEGFLLKKASGQLPNPPEANAINVVTVTGLGRLDKHLRRLIARELATYRNVEALIFRNYASHTAIFSLSEPITHTLAQLVAAQSAVPFQPFYHIVHHLAEGTRRQTARGSKEPSWNTSSAPRLFQRAVRTFAPRRRHSLPRIPYRMDVTSRLPDGEPVFQVVAPFI